MGEYEASQAAILNGADGLHETRYVREKTFWRGASYQAAPPKDDYASRMQRAAAEMGGRTNVGLDYGLGKSERGYISSSQSLASYSSNATMSKPLCCGRRNAGPHMQCGSCPLR